MLSLHNAEHIFDGVISLCFRFLPRGHGAPIIEHHLPLYINTDCLLCTAFPLPLLFISSLSVMALMLAHMPFTLSMHSVKTLEHDLTKLQSHCNFFSEYNNKNFNEESAPDRKVQSLTQSIP